jgi:predicted  nucleic acid-binding Zn-ribbon protein
MNSNIYFDYFNNDYLSSIELFSYKYEIFLCTSSIIIIGIFSIIFNKMNKLNKKLEKELMDLHLTVNVHDDNLTINNNKMIKNYDTLNEENKKLQEEILNLKETINVHKTILMQDNNKFIDINNEIKDIGELAMTNGSNIKDMNNLNKKLQEEILNLKEAINVHESALTQSNNKFIHINNEIKDILELAMTNKSNIRDMNINLEQKYNEFNQTFHNHEVNLIRFNEHIKYNSQNLILIGEKNSGNNILIHKYIDEFILTDLVSEHSIIYLEQLKLLVNIKEIKLSSFFRNNLREFKIILETKHLHDNHNINKCNYITLKYKQGYIEPSKDVLNILEEFLNNIEIKLVIDCDLKNFQLTYYKNIEKYYSKTITI